MTCLLSSYCTKADGCTAHIGVDIERCSAFKQRPQTNFEYLQTCSFEELAGAIYEWYSLGYTQRRLGKPLKSITEVVKWLNEKHTEDTDK